MYTRIKIAPQGKKWSYKLQQREKRWHFWSTKVDGTFIGTSKELLEIFLTDNYSDWFPIVE